jgi:hypothetical protein
MKQADKVLAEALLRVAVVENRERKMAEIGNDETDVCPTGEQNKRMYQSFKRIRFRKTAKRIMKTAAKSIAATMIIFSVFSSALLLSANVRAAVGNTIMEWYKTFTLFSYESSPAEPELREWELNYILDGFEESTSNYIAGASDKCYPNDGGDVINFSAYPVGSRTVAVDNEHSEYKVIADNEIEYHVFISTDNAYTTSIIWTDAGYDFLLSSDYAFEALLKAAQSVDTVKK